jgi:hypothetical protein
LARSGSGRRSRKRRAGSAARNRSSPAEAVAEPSTDRPQSRSAAKDAAARAQLAPLREGERPLAVTVAAVVAFLMGAATLVLYAAGVEISGGRPSLALVIGQSGLFLIAAWGMWRARYWAVLGMQALLGIVVAVYALQLFISVATVQQALVAIAVILAAGTLFWFLVKAMARLQMPERR